MKQVTVKELAMFAFEEVKKGNGDKVILISDDNEGNGYHGLFYHFTPADGFEGDYFHDTTEKDPKKVIILG